LAQEQCQRQLAEHQAEEKEKILRQEAKEREKLLKQEALERSRNGIARQQSGTKCVEECSGNAAIREDRLL